LELASNRSNQVFQLYTILQKRVNAFEVLLDGLKQTNQSRAIEILTSCLEPNSSSITPDISYDVNKVLGNGSYGTVVYKGKFGDRDVAIKKVHLSMLGGPQAFHEVKVLKDYDVHENVVRYFGAKKNKEFVLIALELCEMSLTQWVENNAKNETSTFKISTDFSAMEVLRQITVGLEWLHSKKIVHRDIKPENVLIMFKTKRAKLSDFGLSRRILDGNSFVVTSIAGGTPGWMAPEILSCVVERKNAECKFTYASDVFSLGCVYYFVLTDGKYAFGDLVRCQANILDGKSVIAANEIKQDCARSTMFNLIELMISKDLKCRPACAVLVSNPVWNKCGSTFIDLDKTTVSSPAFPETHQNLTSDVHHVPSGPFEKVVDHEKQENVSLNEIVKTIPYTAFWNFKQTKKIAETGFPNISK
ncbi:Serine/threonine-protein kinase/endoribonuclease IRE1, partial [Orchesella cincta]